MVRIAVAPAGIISQLTKILSTPDIHLGIILSQVVKPGLVNDEDSSSYDRRPGNKKGRLVRGEWHVSWKSWEPFLKLQDPRSLVLTHLLAKSLGQDMWLRTPKLLYLFPRPLSSLLLQAGSEGPKPSVLQLNTNPGKRGLPRTHSRLTWWAWSGLSWSSSAPGGSVPIWNAGSSQILGPEQSEGVAQGSLPHWRRSLGSACMGFWMQGSTFRRRQPLSLWSLRPTGWARDLGYRDRWVEMLSRVKGGDPTSRQWRCIWGNTCTIAGSQADILGQRIPGGGHSRYTRPPSS